MEIHISMKTRDGCAFAEGVYSEEKTIVFAGGKVNPKFNGKNAVKAIRENTEIVSQEGIILQDYEFGSPSTAAQFVNGNISNGMRVWKVDGENLGVYLKRQGYK